MKRILLATALTVLLFSDLTAQTESQAVSDSVNIAQLKSKQKLQQQKLISLGEALNGLRGDISELEMQTQTNAAELEQSLERLAQSERAINASLEQFSERFEEQNATIADVQDVLERRLEDMLLYILGASVLIILLVVVAMRWATNNALKRHESNWNTFQEHIFKNR